MGIGLGIQYIQAHHGSSLFSTEAEYEKLKNQHQQ
jgi:hypothetical protein